MSCVDYVYSCKYSIDNRRPQTQLADKIVLNVCLRRLTFLILTKQCDFLLTVLNSWGSGQPRGLLVRYPSSFKLAPG